MPGRYFLERPLDEIAEVFGAERGDWADPGPRPDAAPGEIVHAIVGGPRRIEEMRWGMIPMGRKNARGRPVMDTLVNARSETLFQKSAYQGLRRAILPVSGWYEWTGRPRNKTRWAIFDPASPLLGFAAVWDLWAAPGGREIASLATVTVEPNRDVKPIHHRMGAILAEKDWPIWLGEEAGVLIDVLKPWPEGRLAIEKSVLD